MNSTRLWVVVASVFMAVCPTGCVHGPGSGTARQGSSFTVSLPPLKLADGEYIQSVEITIEGGRIASLNRTWDDWDMEMNWDRPGYLTLNCEARHFNAGFPSTRAFDRFIVVESNSGSLDIAATVHTASTSDTGRRENVYRLARSDLIFSPPPGASVWRTRAPFDYSPGSAKYVVQWGYDAAEIAKQLEVTAGQLSSLNPGVDLAQLKVGQVLVVSEPARK
ncbi:MAG TPA: LysM domain-containing protein [Candidatus Acidoferrales bacterium]|nr:LysM domain-containing protein [Candidatus Acidoferrales bacterium]